MSLTPCVLPMGPILSAAIVSDASQQASPKRWRALSLSIVYVIGMALVYAVIGVIAGLTGESLTIALQTPWVLGVFASILGLLGISMLGGFDLQVSSGLQNWVTGLSARMPGGQYGSVGMMGALSALLVGPCVAPPLAGALLFVGQTGDFVTGGLALFVLALGLGLPLIVAAGSAGNLLPKAGQWMETIKQLFGVILFALALWTAAPILPNWVLMALWGALFGCVGVGMGAFESLGKPIRLGSVLNKTLALLMLLIALMEWVGLASGGRDVLQPLAHLTGSGSAQTSQNHGLVFEKVKASQVQTLISNSQQTVMLDFYADWCVSCKEMEKLTFADVNVQAELKGVRLLQVDVTNNTDDDKKLLKQFDLFGPPAIVFFNTKGQEQIGARVIGFQDAQRFIKTIKTLGLQS